MALADIVASAPIHSPIASSTDQDMTSPQNEEVMDEVSTPNNVDSDAEDSRRRVTGTLRVSQKHSIQEDVSEYQRQMVCDIGTFPKRRKVTPEQFVFLPSTLDKLITGIWEQIHGTLNLDPQAIFEQIQVNNPAANSKALQQSGDGIHMEGSVVAQSLITDAFSRMNILCQKVTQASRACRSIEIIVQAQWIELFEEQIQLRAVATPEVSSTKHRKFAFIEACQDFGWSAKELRNKMAVWRGYKEVRDAAGWAALVFAGMGIYRFCKYRVEFTKDAMKRLGNLKCRFEVAADTLHPHWRQLLTIVGVEDKLQYTGHPHDWVVFENGSDPVSLRSTYLQQDPYFSFQQLEDSVIDESTWGCDDPRWIPQLRSNSVVQTKDTYFCNICNECQSDDPKLNSCFCFPSLFGCVKRRPPLVQVYRTRNGRSNGLLALAPFERGAAIGEFVGLITKDMQDLDVMESSTPTANYQIWQGRQGNFTRFVNHSCKANAQFQKFVWLDTQRIVLVSKGIKADNEIFVDYGERYWAGLDKACLCGEACCRYNRQRRL